VLPGFPYPAGIIFRGRGSNPLPLPQILSKIFRAAPAAALRSGPSMSQLLATSTTIFDDSPGSPCNVGYDLSDHRSLFLWCRPFTNGHLRIPLASVNIGISLCGRLSCAVGSISCAVLVHRSIVDQRAFDVMLMLLIALAGHAKPATISMAAAATAAARKQVIIPPFRSAELAVHINMCLRSVATSYRGDGLRRNGRKFGPISMTVTSYWIVPTTDILESH
jgi:hypothetical protein